MNPSDAAPIWPLVLYLAAIVLLTLALVAAGFVLGGRGRHKSTEGPFEAGIIPVGYARFRVSAQFYLVAMFFVLFDLEAVFVIAWAVSYRRSGWNGYWELLVFVGELVIGLFYIWRLGALDWAPGRTRLAMRRARAAATGGR